uniref:recombinase family protein n=1 Tax=Agathobacter sp. TaxID=2021311 RepID=UPI0040564487
MERVGIYNRCSTEEEAQINALEVQAQESREIAKRKGWTITAQYIESETGTTIKKRTQYRKMMQDMENDIFDIILIKSIDRLMRSTKDWYLFIDKAVSYNKKLFIYMDNKFYEPEDALITGIKAILAEDFSRELSKKIKHAHKRRQDNKLGINFTRPVFGWDKVGKDEYVINEQEAEYYRLAFAMAYEGHGFYTIAKHMYEQGVRSKVTGNRISETQWRNMLYSPRAHGTVILHKREYDFHAKKFIKLPPEEWIYMEQALPPIVPKSYQEEVLASLKERTAACNFGDSTKREAKIGRTPLSGKLYCSCCGSVYYRKVSHKGEKRELTEWKCKTRMKQGADACKNRNVLEDVVMEIIESACKQQYETMMKRAKEACKQHEAVIREAEENGKQHNRTVFDTGKEHFIEETIRITKQALEGNDTEKELKKMEKELREQEKKKAILLDKLMSGVIDDNDFKTAKAGLSEKIEGLRHKTETAKEKAAMSEGLEKRLEKIREFLQNGDIIEKAEMKDLMQMIDKILVYPDNKLEIRFDKLKFVRFFRYYNMSSAGDGMDVGFYKITAPYIHKDNRYRRREEINKKLIEIFRENPGIKLKDMLPMLEMKESYINASIKQLKDMGKLQYKRYGNHKGEWIVADEEI